NSWHVEEHVARIAVLLLGTVDARPQLQVAGILQLIGSDDPGANGARAVQALPFEILVAVAGLDIPRCDVVQHGVTEDIIERLGTLDIDARPADHYGKLDFPIYLLAQ